MTITNYDFLEEIYHEYQHPWLPFEILEGKPVLQEFYSNNDNFPTIERKLRNIARAYYYELAKEADDFEFTMRPRAQKLSKYWNFIHCIWDDWFLNQGADGQPDHIHNYMHALYYGTLDCVAVLCFAYAKKKLLFDISSFDQLDTAMMGKRLSRYELCDEYTFAGMIERLEWFGDERANAKKMADSASNGDSADDSRPNEASVVDDGSTENASQGYEDTPEGKRAKKWNQKSRKMYETRILKVIQLLVEINVVAINDDKKTYHIVNDDKEVFVYIAKLLHDWWKSKTPTSSSPIGWKYLESYFSVSIEKNERDAIWKAMTKKNNPILPENATEIRKAFRIAGYSPQ